MVDRMVLEDRWAEIVSTEDSTLNLVTPVLFSDDKDDLIGLDDGLRLSSFRDTASISTPVPPAQITAPAHMEVRRQAVVVTTDVDLIVEDGAGSTIAEATLQGLPTAATEVSLPIGTLTIPALADGPPVISLPVNDLNTNQPSPTASPSLSIQVPGSSSQVVLSSPPTPSPESSSTSFPFSTPAVSGTSALPSTAASNSTTVTSSPVSASSIVSNTANSTSVTSTSPSALVTSTSSIQSTTLQSSLTFTASISSTGLATTTTGVAGSFAPGGGTATSAGPSATSSSTATAAPSATPTYVPVVGGVLGGLAGLALLLVAALFFLRWYKRRERAAGRLRDDESATPGTSGSAAPMAQNSTAPWGAATLAPLMRRMRPHSTATATTAETAPSEQGFQKISGRKIESVLVSGGDGFGGRGPGAGNLSGQSFYRDSSGTYGGRESPNSSMAVGPASPRKSAATSDFTDMSGIAGPSHTRGSDKEVVTMRPGPAKQAVTSPAYTFAPQQSDNQAAPPVSEHGYSTAASERLQTPDPLGRSRPSHDGSRGSKFAEDLK